ncbi:MAG: tyrosine-type recombinase/integrase [Rhodocyclaceae bacterium]
MAKLTVKKLESLTPADIGKRLPDEHSLYGVIKARGDGVAVMFRWRYRFDGKLRDYTCGTWPTKSLREIRDAHENARQLLAQGKDPNQDKRIGRLDEKAAQAEAVAHAHSRIADAEAQQARITVTDLFERWAAVELIRRKDGGKEIRRMFQKDVLPTLGPLAVEDVRKGHITAVTDALLARGVTRMAKLIFSLIRQMFRYAVDRDIIENEPTAAIRKSRIGGKPTERDRVLSEDEIRALHRQTPSAQLLQTTEAALWLALATGCRIGELLRAEWQHVRLDAREWFIPADNSKNGKPHTIYLSDFALRHFAALHSINGESQWCFPNRDDSAHVCVKTVTKQLGDRQRGDAAPMSHRSPHTNALALPGGKWTPHDLRRTAATLMTALGVLPEVAEKCLNHTEESRVKRTYQRHSYDAEKREAWRLLGERLELLTRGDDNIVTFKRRSKSAESLTA